MNIPAQTQIHTQFVDRCVEYRMCAVWKAKTLYEPGHTKHNSIRFQTPSFRAPNPHHTAQQVRAPTCCSISSRCFRCLSKHAHMRRCPTCVSVQDVCDKVTFSDLVAGWLAAVVVVVSRILWITVRILWSRLTTEHIEPPSRWNAHQRVYTLVFMSYSQTWWEYKDKLVHRKSSVENEMMGKKVGCDSWWFTIREQKCFEDYYIQLNDLFYHIYDIIYPTVKLNS